MSTGEDDKFKTAASALPLVPYDESLTFDIMQKIAAEPQTVSQTRSAIESTAEHIPVDKLTGQPTRRVIDYKSALLMLLSFAAFVGFFPLDGGESAWSILSWAFALVLLLTLQPFLSSGSTSHGAKFYA